MRKSARIFAMTFALVLSVHFTFFDLFVPSQPDLAAESTPPQQVYDPGH